MQGFALLFRRDLVQRLPLLIASFAMGLFNACVPFLPGTNVPDAELRGAAGLITALSWAAVLALLFGGSIFTRDLTENRLAFDFRLPVRPGAIWAARLLAAIITIAVAAGLVLAPSAVAGMDLASAAAGFDEWIGHGAQGVLAWSPLAILAILLLAHPIALAARTRSGWAAVDMFSLALVVVATWWSWQQLREWQAQRALWQSIGPLSGVAFLGAATASILQFSRGRTEADKAQKVLSLCLLTTALVGATAALGISQWTLRPTLQDMLGNTAHAQSLGPDWVLLEGPTRRALDVRARFLMSPASGRLLRLGPLPGDPGTRKSVSTSIDDSTIAWIESDGESGALRFFRFSTGAEEPIPQATPTLTSDRCVNWVLSPDGALVAALEMLGKETDPMHLVVSRLATGDVVASVQFPHCRVFGDMLFASDKEVLIPCGVPSYTDLPNYTYLVRVDLVSKTTLDEAYHPTFPPALDASLGLVRTSRGWLNVEVTKPEPKYGRQPDYGFQTAWRLRDFGSDRVIAELAPPSLVPGYARVHGSELRDGTIAMAFSGRENGLGAYTANGKRLQSFSALSGRPMILAESPDSGALLVGLYGRAFNGAAQFSFIVVDLRNGTTRPLEKGLQPAGWLGEIGSTHSVLYNGSGRLVWFNPQTKGLQPLLPEARYFEVRLPTDR